MCFNTDCYLYVIIRRGYNLHVVRDSTVCNKVNVASVYFNMFWLLFTSTLISFNQRAWLKMVASLN